MIILFNIQHILDNLVLILAIVLNRVLLIHKLGILIFKYLSTYQIISNSKILFLHLLSMHEELFGFIDDNNEIILIKKIYM